MNVTRLLKLADFLETVPAEKFDLASWRNNAPANLDLDEGEQSTEYWISKKITDERLQGCGYTACAIGWATAMPEFKSEGFYWNLHTAMPAFGALEGWEAIQAFFGINHYRAVVLFTTDGYGGEYDNTTAGVARYIREEVADYQAEEEEEVANYQADEQAKTQTPS